MTKLYQSGDRYFFWCPGCKEPHFYQTSGSPAWQFNGDLERPTFTPSLLNTTRRGDVDHTCHLFLTDGNLQFGADCSHEYRAQTVPLPDWEREENAMHRTMRDSKKDDGENLAQTPPPAQPATAPEPLPCFLQVADHVVSGLEDREIVIAKDQPQYKPLAVLPAGDERGTVLSRWTFDDAARAAVAKGADLYLEVLTFGHPFQPTVMFVHEKLDAQMVLEGFFAPVPIPGLAGTTGGKKLDLSSAAGLEPQPEANNGKEVEEPHEAHHVKCRACGVWFNKNDPACPNCNERTPIIVGG